MGREMHLAAEWGHFAVHASFASAQLHHSVKGLLVTNNYGGLVSFAMGADDVVNAV